MLGTVSTLPTHPWTVTHVRAGVAIEIAEPVSLKTGRRRMLRPDEARTPVRAIR